MSSDAQTVSLDLPASAIFQSAPPGLGDDVRIVLRPLALTDAPTVAQAVADSLPELLEFMPWAHHPQTVEGQRQRIIDAIHAYWRGTDYVFGVFGASSGRVLGGAGLHRRTLNPKGLEIGYWIHSGFAGKGLATAVTRSLIVYGFEHLSLTRVQCGHDVANVASARVNDKCGLRIEGRFRNFDGVPSDVMRARGWKGSGEIVVRGLCPEDVPDLPWYGAASQSLEVFDWLGRAVVRTP